MKPIVYYQYPAALPPVVGQRAIVVLLSKHPNPQGLVSNTNPILTSNVLSIDKFDFETENTLYRGRYQ